MCDTTYELRATADEVGAKTMSGDSTRMDIMSIDQFTQWLATSVDWSPAEISPEDNLVEDLGMDSVGAVDLLVALEDAVGADVIMPIELLLQISTVRDAYLQYCALTQLPFQTESVR